jgi:alpha-ketoglutarate-dependent taurine dioxygenase
VSVLRKAPPVRRQALDPSPEKWVSLSPLFAGQRLPLLATPAADGVSLAEWMRRCPEALAGPLRRHGAILCRGFGLRSLDDLRELVEAAAGAPLDYHERTSPRHQVGHGVFTSTDHPADHDILLHNENSYAFRWPGKIFFFCRVPAASGGETPIADSRAVLAQVPAGIRERFDRLGVVYVRNYGDGFGLSWQAAFQTEAPSVVEEYCRGAGIECEWRSGNRLRTHAPRPAITLHPVTRERLWFNQVALFHPAGLAPEERGALRAEFAADELPVNVTYGDGSAIEDEVVAEILAAYERETVAFAWQRGDLLVLDNMLAAHGRRPFAGPREIVVSMAEPLSWKNI